MTSMQRINPGLSTHDLNAERIELSRSEIHIRYDTFDTKGIVQELSFPKRPIRFRAFVTGTRQTHCQ